MDLCKNNCGFWLVYFIHCLYGLYAVQSTEEVDNYNKTKVTRTDNKGNHSEMTHKFYGSNKEPIGTGTPLPKLRVKRQSGAGKYTDAAKLPQVKVLRLLLQMLRNSWADVYVGGAHPFHHEVPKPVVQLLKDKIIDFFFPNVGDEYKKTK